MRVVVVIPTIHYKFKYPAPSFFAHFPMGPLYVAAALRDAGHQVCVCNPNNEFGYSSATEMLESILGKSLNDFQPEAVCLGGLCIDFNFIRDAMAIVRRELPNIPIILGGAIVTHDSEFIFNKLRPDYAVKGYAEWAVAGILKHLGGGMWNVPNILYWKEGKVVATKKDYRYPRLETLPYPAFDLIDAEKTMQMSLAAPAVFRYSQTFPRQWPIVAGRGCLFKCTFCVHETDGASYHTRPIQDVIREIEYFRQRYDFNILIIVDELFAPSQRRLTEFTDAIQAVRMKHDWNLSWWFQNHLSAKFTEDGLRKAKRAGCHAILWGVESGSPAILASMNKRSTVKQAEEMLAMSRKVGIGFGSHLLFGDPAETPVTLAETWDFWKQHGTGAHWSMTSIQPYPGSKLYRQFLGTSVIPNAEHFYEHLDEQRHTMTGAFPKRLWELYCAIASFAAYNGLYAKRAIAKVGEEFSLPNLNLWMIPLFARCPHCGVDFTFFQVRQLTKKKDATQSMPQTRLLLALLRLKNTRLFLLALRAFIVAVAFRFRWFGTLLNVIRSTVGTSHSAAAGCPTCNQSVRLEWK